MQERAAQVHWTEAPRPRIVGAYDRGKVSHWPSARGALLERERHDGIGERGFGPARSARRERG